MPSPIIDTGFLTSLFGRGAEGGKECEPFTALVRGGRGCGLRSTRAVRGRVGRGRGRRSGGSPNLGRGDRFGGRGRRFPGRQPRLRGSPKVGEGTQSETRPRGRPGRRLRRELRLGFGGNRGLGCNDGFVTLGDVER